MAGRQTAEQIYRGLLRGPLVTKAQSDTDRWAGRSTTLSGVATYSIATTAVQSDSIIWATGESSVASNIAQVIKVNTINPGVGFGFAVNPAPVGVSYSIMWMIVRTS